MKRFLTFLTGLLLLGTIASAQEPYKAHVGFKVGANFSNFRINDVEDHNVKISPQAGIFAKLPLNSKFAIQPELLYTNKGSQVRYNGLLGSGEYRFNLNYLQLPVAFVFNPIPTFSIHAGAYTSYLTGANTRYNKDEEVNNLNEDDFNRIDYGMVYGISADVNNVGFGFRYDQGLNNVGKNRDFDQSLRSAKNNSFHMYMTVGL